MIQYNNEPNENLIIVPIIIIIAFIILIIITSVGISKMFEKIGEKKYKAFIPFYNLYIFTKYFQMEKINQILSLIPIINIFIWYKVADNIAKCYNKDNIYTINLFLMPFIFLFLIDKGEIQYEEEKNNYLEDQSALNEKVEKEETKDQKEELEIKPEDLIWQKKDYTNVPKYKVERKQNKPIEKVNLEAKEIKEPKANVCPECGASVREHATNCFLCGAKLK